MLSTIDNPFNPFDNYPAWYAFDAASCYHTQQLLSRIVQTSDELSEAEYESAIENAVDEIVAENVMGVFIKVVREE